MAGGRRRLAARVPEVGVLQVQGDGAPHAGALDLQRDGDDVALPVAVGGGGASERKCGGGLGGTIKGWLETGNGRRALTDEQNGFS